MSIKLSIFVGALVLPDTYVPHSINKYNSFAYFIPICPFLAALTMRITFPPLSFIHMQTIFSDILSVAMAQTIFEFPFVHIAVLPFEYSFPIS